MRHFQRNYQQRHGEGKDRVRKAFQPRDLPATPAEVRLRRDQMSASAFVKHDRYCATASIIVGDGVSVPNSPSHRAMTALARQLPRTLTAVRAMSMNGSMPRMNTGSVGRWKESSRAKQDHQHGARNSGDAFAGKHQREDHDQLLAKREMNAGGLRDEDGCQREIERAAVQIEAVAGGNDEGDDLPRNAEGLHLLHGAGQRRL